MTEIQNAPPEPDAPSASPEETGDGGGAPFGRRVAAVMRALDARRGVTGRRGLLAALRRISDDPRDLPPEEFWDLVQHHGIPQSEEPLWLRMLPLMAVHPNDPSRSVAAALEEERVTPARLERWLRADRDEALKQAPRILARLGGGVRWVDLAYLLRDWTPEQRRGLAREFFRNRHRRTSSSQGA